MNSANYKAIDIVLLPPDNVAEGAIRISNQVENAENIKLNKTNQLPHISILMGGMKFEQIDFIWQKILGITSGYKKLDLSINEIRIKNDYSGLYIKQNDDLQKLHNLIVSEIMPLLFYDNDVSAFSGDNIKERSLNWLNGFPENSTGENFQPHITLSDKKLNNISDLDLPIGFSVDRIAICELGNYCTCYKIIRLVNL